MNVDTSGAVLALEARVAERDRTRSPDLVQASFQEARRVVGAPGAGRTFTPEPGDSFAGTLTLDDPAEAFVRLERV